MANDPITAVVMKSLGNCMHQEGRKGGEKPRYVIRLSV